MAISSMKQIQAMLMTIRSGIGRPLDRSLFDRSLFGWSLLDEGMSATLISVFSGFVGMAQAWIEDAVQEVHGKVGEHHRDRDEQQDALHDGQIARRDRYDQQVAQS